jgi:DNA-binding response OmpR family regulator
MKILTVDDHAESLFLLGALLRGHGHEVDTASDGHEALKLAESGAYDAVISDILMPRMDGFQFCRELRRSERLRHLPFIFYTGIYTDSRDESFALSLGADRFLVKPLDPGHLLAEIARVVAENAARAPGPAAEIEDEAIYLKEYNARLIAQLEAKVLDLEAANQRLAADAQLRQAQKLEAISTLAGGIAHDFNNLLAGITGFANLGVEAASDQASTAACFRAILKSGLRGLNLVNHLLTFARSGEAERRLIVLAEQAGAAVDQLRSALPAWIELATDFAADAAPVLVAEGQVHTTVAALVSNASDAIGEKPGRIFVQAAPFAVDAGFARIHPGLCPGPYLRLSVTDSGTGIDPAVIGRIFDPFFTTKEFGRGTGLGLSVVHGIMQACDGAIAVDTQPGRGTTVHLFFPAVDRNAPAGERVGRGQRVLFLDDEPVLAALGEDYLSRLGFAPVAMGDPALALGFIRENPCDLVVTDLNMPHLSGIDFAREVWAIRPETRVVLATGFCATLDAHRARELGFRDVLLKPYSIHGLGECVVRALGT